MEYDCTISGIYNRTVANNVPLSVIFELTYRCNLRCRQCYLAGSNEKELEYDEIIGILDQLAAANTLFLTLTGGEVMVRNDFFDIAKYARQKGFAIKIFTNGTLIDEAAARTIAAIKPVSVGISIYGADAMTHDYYTQQPGSFTRSINALKILRASGVTTVVKYLVMEKNFSQIVAMKQLSIDIDAIPHFDPVITPKNNGDRSPSVHRISEDQLFAFYYNEEREEENEQPRHSPGSIMCRAGRDMFSITPSGDVYPCVAMPLAMGNLRERSFAEIWNGVRMNQLRAYRFGDARGCRDCHHLDHCVRCWGLALVESGDLLGTPESNCRVARVRHRVSIERGKTILGGTPHEETLSSAQDY